MVQKRLVISLVGKQGAGKTTLGGKLARYLDTIHVEVSDVVKELNKSVKNRSDLPSTGKKTRTDPDWLGRAIFDKLITPIQKGKQALVITGVREIEIHSYLKKQGLTVIGIEINAAPDTRYQRLLNLHKVESTDDFLNHEIRERNLGVNEVIDSCKYEVSTNDDVKPDKVVRSLVSKLIKEGSTVR